MSSILRKLPFFDDDRTLRVPHGTGPVVAIRHHQGHRGGDLAPTYAARYEPVAEVIQSRGEYPDWVQSLWRQGMRVGMVGAAVMVRLIHMVTALRLDGRTVKV